MDLDLLGELDDRLQELTSFSEATKYSKQKESLQKQFENFLASLPGYPSLFVATPKDVCRFLVFKDRNGKTQVHRKSCPHLGTRGIQQCGCPLRLAYKTVDSYIGKLRSIFHSIGRDGEWDSRLGLGNPAADKSIKEYLRVVTMEQLQARVRPKQASPFFINKLVRLSAHIDKKLEASTIKATNRFILARDQAYFKAVFFSGDRPGDMGQVKIPEILRFPNNDGLLFNHVWGKTLRDSSANIFGIQRNPQLGICPVRGIERYMHIAEQMNVDLKNGFLFRPTNQQGAIVNEPFRSSTAEARLKMYLKEMGNDDGETLHGFRAGCAITLALSGIELSEIMDHVGWTQRHTALYYFQLAKVLNPSGASARLAQVESSSISPEWEDMNTLRRFVTAFPTDK